MGRDTDVNEENGVVGSARAASAGAWARAWGSQRRHAVNHSALQRPLLSVLEQGNGGSTATKALCPSS